MIKKLEKHLGKIRQVAFDMQPFWFGTRWEAELNEKLRTVIDRLDDIAVLFQTQQQRLKDELNKMEDKNER
jgi:hypothetical protein